MPFTKLSDWWEGLEKKAKTIAAMIAVVVGIAAFPLWLETRYATAEDVKEQIGSIKKLYIQSERRGLKKELFEYEVKAKRQRLSDLEEQRVRQLQDELREVEEQYKQTK